MPPDYTFVTGKKHSTFGFLLWDSIESEIVFIKKNFPEIAIKDIDREIK